MSSTAIRVEGLGKRYQIRHGRSGETLREMLMRLGSAPIRCGARLLGRPGGPGRRDREAFWALKDVSFEVKQGEVVGVIGRNGAGKSTLLKILSRITEPTAGFAEIRGRVGTLLEVGTGFHSELTGRENIYLNGSILGMKQATIGRYFDEIVAFAEVEHFLDTPVKHYSSGMYMRLAFAVAAYLQPDILLVDEVLAVGDAGFQKKCLAKMGDVARQGRTVLFVSHSMAAVANLCRHGLVFCQGQLVFAGGVEEAIRRYLDEFEGDEAPGPLQLNRHLLERLQQGNACGLHIKDVELLGPGGNPVRVVGTGDDLLLRIRYRADRKMVAPAFLLSIADQLGVEVIRLSTLPISGYFIEAAEGDGTLELAVKGLPLTGGTYALTVAAGRANLGWEVRYEAVARLHVAARDVYRSGVAMDNQRGLIVVKHHWKHAPGGPGLETVPRSEPLIAPTMLDCNG
jgi:lipopolysaccharide transport system ATP-binding protein